MMMVMVIFRCVVYKPVRLASISYKTHEYPQ